MYIYCQTTYDPFTFALLGFLQLALSDCYQCHALINSILWYPTYLLDITSPIIWNFDSKVFIYSANGFTFTITNNRMGPAKKSISVDPYYMEDALTKVTRLTGQLFLGTAWWQQTTSRGACFLSSPSLSMQTLFFMDGFPALCMCTQAKWRPVNARRVCPCIV